MTAPVCASDSRSKTPGIVGSPGKWPVKKGSLTVTFFAARQYLPGTSSRTLSMRRNGYRCGRSWLISWMSRLICHPPYARRRLHVQRVPGLDCNHTGTETAADEREVP